MVPVDQESPWDCVRASVASVLGLPLCAVPELPEDDRQYDRLAEWLACHGLSLREVAPGTARGYSLLSGVSPRLVRHSVVGRGGRVLFDPHRSRAGLILIDRERVVERGPPMPARPSVRSRIESRRAR